MERGKEGEGAYDPVATDCVRLVSRKFTEAGAAASDSDSSLGSGSFDNLLPRLPRWVLVSSQCDWSATDSLALERRAGSTGVAFLALQVFALSVFHSVQALLQYNVNFCYMSHRLYK